jgi:hypothetical protein
MSTLQSSYRILEDEEEKRKEKEEKEKNQNTKKKMRNETKMLSMIDLRWTEQNIIRHNIYTAENNKEQKWAGLRRTIQDRIGQDRTGQDRIG